MKRVGVVLAAGLIAGCASLNVKKTCYGDGVCRVERNGQVSYEGPPDKVAQYQAKDQQKSQAAADLDKAWAEAPKRPGNESIRVAVVPTSDYQDLVALAPRYRAMLEDSLRADPRIEIVPYDRVKLLAEAHSGDQPAGFGQQTSRAAVDEALTRSLRDFNIPVDVVLVVHLTPKKDSGLVAGGGGIGVADVVNVQFDTSLSSVYQFDPKQTSQVGKSTDRIHLAGFNKNGQKGEADLHGKRNPARDAAAIDALGGWARQVIETQVAPNLPSMAGVQQVEAKARATNTKNAPAWLQRLMKK